MRLIGHVHAEEAYRETVGRLHSKGIPTFSKFSGSPGQLPTPYRVAIFVHFNRQYDDAVSLLQDPHHVVTDPVDVYEFEKAQLDQATPSLIYKWIAYIAIAVVLTLFAVFWLGGYTLAATPNNSFKPNTLRVSA